MWRNVVQANRRMRFECWTYKSYNQNMKYLLLFHCNMFERTRLRFTFILKYKRKTEACGRSPAEILGSNPTGGMFICLL